MPGREREKKIKQTRKKAQSKGKKGVRGKRDFKRKC